MRRPVHVVHIIPSLRRGGAETALSRIVQHTDRAVVRHTVISLTTRGALAGPIEAGGGRVVALGVKGAAAMPFALPRLISEVRRLEPEFVQGWMIHSNILAWLARGLAAPRARLGWNLRATARDLVHESWLTRGLTRAAAAASRSVDIMISNSTTGLNDFLGIGYAPRASVVAPNGFDLDLFRPDPAQRRWMRSVLGLHEGAVVFGLIGRFHPQKGHRVFVEAAARVFRRHPETVFLLAGPGTAESAELRRMIAASGAAGVFRLIGERGDVVDVTRALDVACLPSFYEGFPNVVGEAMASGVPCIATDVSDVKLILGEGGLVVPTGDVDALEAAMLRMIAMGDAGRSELGAAGRRRAERCYSIGSAARLYEEIYSALASARHSAEPRVCAA